MVVGSFTAEFVEDFRLASAQCVSGPWAVVMLVCRSVAEIVKFPSLISKRKFSNIGKTVLLLDAPFTVCKCFNNVDVDTINLIV